MLSVGHELEVRAFWSLWSFYRIAVIHSIGCSFHSLPMATFNSAASPVFSVPADHDSWLSCSRNSAWIGSVVEGFIFRDEYFDTTSSYFGFQWHSPLFYKIETPCFYFGVSSGVSRVVAGSLWACIANDVRIRSIPCISSSAAFSAFSVSYCRFSVVHSWTEDLLFSLWLARIIPH